jgi:hypothetical protein
MKAKDARLKAEFVRFILRNKTIEELIEEIYEEIRMAWAEHKTKITKLMDPRHKNGIKSFLEKKGFYVVDITMKNADEETPRELLISWKKGGLY